MAATRNNPAPASLAMAQTLLRSALQQPKLSLPPLPLPAIALRVTNMSEDESDAATLAGLIQKDAGLAAEIVKVANSALYARRSPVTSLQQAISWLGIAEVRKVAVSCALRAQVFAGAGTQRALAPIWNESLATACFCQEIARLRRRGVEPAYLAGLLHRAGYAALVQLLARKQLPADLLADSAALAELAAEHESALGQFLARDWSLPDLVAAGLQHWRSPGTAAALALPKPQRLAMLEVILARAMAAQLGQPEVVAEDSTPPEVVGAAAEIAAELGIYLDDLQTLWGKRAQALKLVESLQ